MIFQCVFVGEYDITNFTLLWPRMNQINVLNKAYVVGVSLLALIAIQVFIWMKVKFLLVIINSCHIIKHFTTNVAKSHSRMNCLLMLFQQCFSLEKFVTKALELCIWDITFRSDFQRFSSKIFPWFRHSSNIPLIFSLLSILLANFVNSLLFLINFNHPVKILFHLWIYLLFFNLLRFRWLVL